MTSQPLRLMAFNIYTLIRQMLKVQQVSIVNIMSIRLSL